jgi:hypothetical protein
MGYMPDSLKDQLDYVMKHFLAISDQRIKSTHYYILVLVASTGATFKLFEKFDKWTALAVALAHTLTIIVFAMIERRNNSLLEIAREALADLEDAHGDWLYWSRISNRDAERRPRKMNYTNALALALATQVLVVAILVWFAFFGLPFGPSK